MAGPDERVVSFRPRTIITAAVLLVAIGVVLWIVWVSRRVLIWTFVVGVPRRRAESGGRRPPAPRDPAARRRGGGRLHPDGRGHRRRSGRCSIPTLVKQVNDLVDAAPGYVQDLTHGRGPLGFLETKYHVVERVQDAVKGNGSGRLAGGATAALDVTRSVITFVAGVVTIAFMTFFMLLEGEAWKDRFIALLPAKAQPRAQHMASEIAAHHRRLRVRQPVHQRHRGLLRDDRAARGRRAVRARPRAPRRDPGSHPAGRRDPRGDHRHARRAHALGDRGADRARVLHRLPAAREPPAAADRLRAHGPALAARDPRRPSSSAPRSRA